MTPLSKPVHRLVSIAGQDYVVTLDTLGVSIRVHKRRKGVSISYQQLAAQGLDNCAHLRWPESLHNQPLTQLQHLTRRHV
jgi:hypothetical protein